MPDMSRIERFDEVFRTLLVVASILAAFSLKSFPEPLLSQAFQTLLFLLLSLLLWVVAALWGTGPGACITRLLALETLVVAISRTLSRLFILFPPAGSESFLASWAVLLFEVLSAFILIGLGGLYLRLRMREILIAYLLGIGLLPSAYLLILRSYPLPSLALSMPPSTPSSLLPL